MQQQPKNILKKFSVRNHSIGKERRRNLTKQTLDRRIHFPKPVTYADMDQCVFDWLDKELYFEYDGYKYPTYKLYSTQRINEYGQGWEKIDDKGNLEVNFKTITREPNPQKGDSQGGFMNIPGYRDYKIFENIVSDENGYDHKEIYTMKQPTAVNMMYTINLVTSSYRALNKFNQLMQIQFNSIQKYVFPNGFAMPLTLESISDESDWTLDDRKFYSQTYQIKLAGFMIREEDYSVKIVPIRERMQFVASGTRRKSEKKCPVEFLKTEESTYKLDVVNDNECNEDASMTVEKVEIPFEELYNPISGHSEAVEYEEEGLPVCDMEDKDEHENNLRMKLTFDFGPCNNTNEYTFDSEGNDYQWILEKVETDNIKDYTIKLKVRKEDGEDEYEEIDIKNNDVEFVDGDELLIDVTTENPFKDGTVTIICYEPNLLDEEK